jgi:hypothetical protein
MVRYKKDDRWEAWSSLAAFSSAHPKYPAHYIRRRTVDGVFNHYLFELRRVPWKLNPIKPRRGGIKRIKSGPKGPRTVRT